MDIIKRDIDPAIIEFGKIYVKYLIATEIVSRGMGPAKYLKPGQKENTVIFDTCILDEDRLSALAPVWKDERIIKARAFALIPEKDRGNRLRLDTFEREYAQARAEVWDKFRSVFDEAYKVVHTIQDPLARKIRLQELKALKANFNFAGWKLRRLTWRLSFKDCQRTISGSDFYPSEENLDELTEKLSKKLGKHGFNQGNLGDRVLAMEGDSYLQQEQVVQIYSDIIKKLCPRVNKLLESLGMKGIEAKMNVFELPETEKKGASMQYCGDGIANSYIKPSATTTRKRICRNAVHEMTHFLDGVLAEIYFRETEDLFGAFGTMCTSTACRAEGLSELGSRVYAPVIEEEFRDAPWMLEILEMHSALKLDAIHHACGAFNERWTGTRDEVRGKLWNFYKKYGLDETSARNLSTWPSIPDRENKNWFYSPYYGIGRKAVERVFALSGSFEGTLETYAKMTTRIGPVTIQSLEDAMHNNSQGLVL